MTRMHRPFALIALWLCAAALLQAGTKARADINITLFPRTISGTVSGDVIIYNPFHSKTPQVTFAPDAQISGSVKVYDNCAVSSAGRIAGTVYTYNNSSANIQGGSVGGVQTYNASSATLTAPTQTSLSVGSIDAYNTSQVIVQGTTISANTHTMAAKLIYCHDNAQISGFGVDAPNGLWTEQAGNVYLNHCTIGFVVCTDSSMVGLDTVYCSAGMLQFRSSQITIYPGTTVMSNIIAYGWEDAVDPAGKYSGRVYVQGGTLKRGVYAKGGKIEIWGGTYYGSLYADPIAPYNLPGITVYGYYLKISSTGRLTGFINGSPIDVPCSGAISLSNF